MNQKIFFMNVSSIYKLYIFVLMRCGRDPKSSYFNSLYFDLKSPFCRCNFLNFARNRRCLKCNEDGPKRVWENDIEMKNGDWICPE